ncbi:MAG: (deoxy)nucleoside triphosphate pyrophosphohydrolase [Pseudomonadota bacterium]
MKIVYVVSVALIDKDKKILLAKRPEGKAMAGLWEFPGGKIESGEIPEQALIRELKEELAIDVCEPCLSSAGFVSYAYTNKPKETLPDCDCNVDNRYFVPAYEMGLAEEFHLIMLFYVCYKWTGIPQATENQELGWYDIKEFANLAMPPADKPLIEVLKNIL